MAILGPTLGHLEVIHACLLYLHSILQSLDIAAAHTTHAACFELALYHSQNPITSCNKPQFKACMLTTPLFTEYLFKFIVYGIWHGHGRGIAGAYDCPYDNYDSYATMHCRIEYMVQVQAHLQCMQALPRNDLSTVWRNKGCMCSVIICNVLRAWT